MREAIPRLAVPLILRAVFGVAIPGGRAAVKPQLRRHATPGDRPADDLGSLHPAADDFFPVLRVITAVHATAGEIDSQLRTLKCIGPRARAFSIPFQEHPVTAPAFAVAGDRDDLPAVPSKVPAEISAQEAVCADNDNCRIHKNRMGERFSLEVCSRAGLPARASSRRPGPTSSRRSRRTPPAASPDYGRLWLPRSSNPWFPLRIC